MKKRTTVYMEEDVLRAAKVRAAREGLHDYEVMEAALRQYLGFDVLDRIRERNAGTDEDTVMAAAVAAVHEVRAERSKAAPRRARG